MVICLKRGADLHVAQLMPLPFTVSCSNKIQIGFNFWYRLTWVVPDKGPLNVCVCVCVCVRVCVCVCWCCYLSGARCIMCAYGPSDATASKNPIISCLILIQASCTFWYLLTQVVPEKRPLNGCSSSSSLCCSMCLYSMWRKNAITAWLCQKTFCKQDS